MVPCARQIKTFCLTFLALVLLALTPRVSAADDPEARVREIEQLAYAAPPGVSGAKIAALEAQKVALTPAQRQRLEFVRLRNLGLLGKQDEAMQGLVALLKQDLPPPLRDRTYATAANLAANLEKWSMAFGLLEESQRASQGQAEESAVLFSVAAYLYALVDELERARKMGLHALQLSERLGVPLAQCRALAVLGLIDENAKAFKAAEDWRRRQLVACQQAEDKVFVAIAKLGIGQAKRGLGQHAQALAWAEQAIADYQALGFDVGTYSARQTIANSLIALHREPERARRLLNEAVEYYRGENAHQAIAETEFALATLAEQRGEIAQALRHMHAERLAAQAANRSLRDRQLAYLQVQFDNRFNEQQVELLKAEASLADAAMSAARSRQWLFATGAALLLAIAGLLVVLLQRSRRERLRYRWRSEHDGLTRLFNYPHLLQEGEAAFALARSQGRPITALVLDVDRFKQVNDRYGHDAGDEALRMLAGWIRQSIGAQDIAGRRGGDEFTILCDGDAESAEAVVQCLRRLICPVTAFGHSFLFTISAGIRQMDAQTPSLAQLIHDADQSLLRAKRAGRDRVIVHRQASEATEGTQPGSLVVVGSGIQFGRHISERGLTEIQDAEVVMCLTDPYALGMIKRLRPDAVNLGVHYAPGKDRRETYREIDAVIMAELRAGKRVCAVFYGHPGVFADVPHRVMRKARELGLDARMEPGISAEACLYADIGLDPGHRGVQSMEATHFLCYDRQPDTTGLVLLWQVALSGDLTCTRLHAERYGLQALVDKLQRWYPGDHEVILYEAAQLPIESPRIERLPLRALPDAQYQEYTTLVIPPLDELRDDPLTGRGPNCAGEAG